MHLIEQKQFVTKTPKNSQNVEKSVRQKVKKGLLPNFIGKNEKKNFFSKKLNVAVSQKTN